MTDEETEPTITPEVPAVIIKPTIEELRAAEITRIDTLIESLWKPATHGSLGAVDRVIKLSERKAKLLGLDAASAVDMTFKRMSDSELTEYIAREIADISASDSASES